jgi:hypothetical protein
MGGMIALVPDDDSLGNLAVDGGEDPSELHATLLYLGDDDDVNGWSDDQRANLGNLVASLAPGVQPIDAHVVGPAHFNPTGGPDGDMDPCVVHLIGGSGDLSDLRDYLTDAINGSDDYPDLPAQHPGYLPHVTAGYGLDPSQVSYGGPVRFDKLRYAVGDDVQDFPLGVDPDSDGDDDTTPEGDTDHDVWPVSGEEKSACGAVCADLRPDLYALTHDVETKTALCEHNDLGDLCTTLHPGIEHRVIREIKAGEFESVEYKRKFTPEKRKQMAKAGTAMPDGSYPIANHEDLKNALRAYGEAPEGKRAELRAHIKKRAKALGATHMLDASSIDFEPSGKSAENGIEVKVASPDPRAAKLRRYWAFNPVARAKWRPGEPHDFYRLRRQLAKYVHDPHILSGLTANIHHLALGVWPGHEDGGKLGKKELPQPMPLLGDSDDPEQYDPGMPDDDEAAMFDGVDPVALLLIDPGEMDEFGNALLDNDETEDDGDGVEGDADEGPVVEADQGLRIKSAEVVITPLELKALDRLTAEFKAAPGSLDDLMLETDRLGLLDVSAGDPGDQNGGDVQTDIGDDDWADVLRRDKRWLLGGDGDLVDGGPEQGKNTQDDDNGLGSNGTVGTAQTGALNMPASLFDGI